MERRVSIANVERIQILQATRTAFILFSLMQPASLTAQQVQKAISIESYHLRSRPHFPPYNSSRRSPAQ